MEPLGDGEFGELDDLLLSDDLPEECMDAVTLEGFLLFNNTVIHRLQLLPAVHTHCSPFPSEPHGCEHQGFLCATNHRVCADGFEHSGC